MLFKNVEMTVVFTLRFENDWLALLMIYIIIFYVPVFCLPKQIYRVRHKRRVSDL